MPKPTNTQELTARYLAAGAGFKPEEQFKALLNAASHVADRRFKEANNLEYPFEKLTYQLLNYIWDESGVMEELANDKAPF